MQNHTTGLHVGYISVTWCWKLLDLNSFSGIHINAEQHRQYILEILVIFPVLLAKYTRSITIRNGKYTIGHSIW